MQKAVKMEEITQQSKIFAIKLKGWREEGKKKVWEPGMQGMGGRKFGFNPPTPPSLDFEAAAPNFL